MSRFLHLDHKIQVWKLIGRVEYSQRLSTSLSELYQEQSPSCQDILYILPFIKLRRDVSYSIIYIQNFVARKYFLCLELQWSLPKASTCGEIFFIRFREVFALQRFKLKFS